MVVVWGVLFDKERIVDLHVQKLSYVNTQTNEQVTCLYKKAKMTESAFQAKIVLVSFPTSTGKSNDIGCDFESTPSNFNITYVALIL